MNCKYCQHTLEEDNLICPNCGKDNAEETTEELLPAEETTEELLPAVNTTAEDTSAEEPPVETDDVQETPAEAEWAAPKIKNGITLTPGKLALIIGAVVVLTAVVIGLILSGMGISFSQGTQETTAPAESSATETPATIPADGNPDDVSAKGSYTVSDEEAIAAMDTVVATAGEAELTNGQLQIFYWTQVQNFIANNGSTAYYYYGFDYTQPLDTQICPLSEEGLTWQQYFLKAALDNWHTYQSMANESISAGFELTEELRAELDALPTAMATEGGLQGFDSAESYLARNVGAGATMQNYLDYMELYYQGYMFFQAEYEKMMPTEEEVDAYFTQHEQEYAEGGVTRDTVTVDVRHILVLPEGATVDTIYSETFSDEAWAAGEAEAQKILDEWLAGEASEDTFAHTANAHSADPGSNTNGGLYEGVAQGDMVEAFDAWCFDESRQVGDYGIVRTELGFHIMYFSGSSPLWTEYAKSDLLSERANAMMMSAMEKYPLSVDFGAIKLGYVDMTA